MYSHSCIAIRCLASDVAIVVGAAILASKAGQSPCRSASGMYSPEATAANCASSSCSHSCNHGTYQYNHS